MKLTMLVIGGIMAAAAASSAAVLALADDIERDYAWDEVDIDGLVPLGDSDDYA